MPVVSTSDQSAGESHDREWRKRGPVLLANGMVAYECIPGAAKTMHTQVIEYFNEPVLSDMFDVSEDPTSAGAQDADGAAAPLVVFDVGANIGLFALEITARAGHPELRGQKHPTSATAIDGGGPRPVPTVVYSFEPVPSTYEILQANVKPYADTIHAFPFGIGREDATVTFQHKPMATSMSSMYGEDMAAAPALAAARVAELVKDPKLPAAYRAQFKIPWWAAFLPKFVIAAFVERRRAKTFKSVPVSCRIRRLSDVIRENGVNRIDLLKIDVEMAEMDVLDGLDVSDWNKVQRIVMEVHNVDGRLEKLKDTILPAKGFTHISVDQEYIFKGSNIFNLVASKPLAASAGA